MGFTIPSIVTMGNPNYQMVGQLIERKFKGTTPMFNVGSVWSLVILIFVFNYVGFFSFNKFVEDGYYE